MLLDVVIFPDPRLKKVSQKVSEFGDKLKELADNMFETMYHDEGIGLAAPQIGLNERFIVIDVPLSEDGNQSFKCALANPVIVEKEGEVPSTEGCLSVPDYNAEVKRFQKVTVEYQDTDGQPQRLSADGLVAICLQHEIDHLDGKLFIDYLSPLKRQMLKNKYAKLKKQGRV